MIRFLETAHAAHTTHAAHIRHATAATGAFGFGFISNHGFSGNQQARNRSGILQRGLYYFGWGQ